MATCDSEKTESHTVKLSETYSLTFDYLMTINWKRYTMIVQKFKDIDDAVVWVSAENEPVNFNVETDETSQDPKNPVFRNAIPYISELSDYMLEKIHSHVMGCCRSDNMISGLKIFNGRIALHRIAIMLNHNLPYDLIYQQATHPINLDLGFRDTLGTLNHIYSSVNVLEPHIKQTKEILLKEFTPILLEDKLGKIEDFTIMVKSQRKQ